MLANGQPIEAAADAVGVTVLTVKRWKREGLLDGLAEKNGNGEADPTTLAEARRRKELALARKHELAVKELEGELVRRDTIEKELGPVLDRLRRGIMNIEGRWANHFPGCEPEDAAPVLRRMAHELLEELSGVS